MRRSSEQQTQANRRNAQLNSGPRTAAGKAASSNNALTHFLSTNRTVLPSENLQDFRNLLADLEREFEPKTAWQRSLVRQLADTEWRLRRVPDLEAGLLTRRLGVASRWIENHAEKGPDDERQLDVWLRGEVLIDDAAGVDSLSKLSRYETRLIRLISKRRRACKRFKHPVKSAVRRSPNRTRPKNQKEKIAKRTQIPFLGRHRGTGFRGAELTGTISLRG